MILMDKIQISQKQVDKLLQSARSILSLVGSDASLLQVCNQIERQAKKQVAAQARLQKQVAQLKEIYNNLDDKEHVDLDIKEVFESETPLADSQEQCLSALIQLVGFKRAKTIIDAEKGN